MNEKYEQLLAIIAEQQKGHEQEPIFMIGEQLKDMAKNDPAATDLLVCDLQTENMKLSDAAAELQKYADQNRGKAKCFCITPKVAEGILRKFYGLSEAGEDDTKSEDEKYIDLSAFL